MLREKILSQEEGGDHTKSLYSRESYDDNVYVHALKVP